MLTIILKILSILGILLLVLLGVLLSAVLLVLFVPVTYRVRADRQEAVPEGNSDGTGEPVFLPLMHIAVRADWLLGILRVRFQYPDPGTVTVKFLCFTLFDSGTENERAEKRTKAGGQAKRTAERTKTIKPEEKAAAHTNMEAERTETKTESDEVRTGAQSAAGAYREEKAGSEEKSRLKQNPFEKIRYTFRRLCAKIKELWENFTYYREVLLCEDTRDLVHHALMRLGRILKNIRPRKLRADIRFGTGSPDTTGYAFGVYGMFCSWLGKQVIVTPDFERAVLAGELDAAGHITAFKLLWHGLMLVTDRRLRELIDKLRRA